MARKPTPQHLDQYRDTLLRLRETQVGRIQGLEGDAFSDESSRFTTDNPADTGSETFSQAFSLELLRRDEAILEAIVAALERLERGEFGRCSACRKWIQRARLEAVPFARLCIQCQQRAEETG